MSIGKAVLLAFALLPLAEIATFVLVARSVGVLWALALLLAATIAGVAMLRRAGRTEITRLRVALADQSVSDLEIRGISFLYVIVGVLLLVPGFLTDIVALLLLVPAVRNGIKSVFSRAFAGADRPRREAVVDLQDGEWRRVPEARIEPPGTEKRADPDRSEPT